MIGNLVHDRVDEVDSPPVFVKRVSWLGELADVESLTMIVNADCEQPADNPDLDMHFLGGIPLVGVLNGIGHGFRQDQVQFVGEFFPITPVMLERQGNVFSDMADQAEVTGLVGNLDVNFDPVGVHAWSPGILLLPVTSSLRCCRTGSGKTGQRFVDIGEDFKNPVQSSQFEHRLDL